MTNIKHFIYTIGTLFVFAFGLTMLNQSMGEDMSNAATVVALAIIAFSGFLSYEIITTENYKLLPVLVFGGVIVTLFAALFRFGG